jgi:hypothetical protein
MPACVWRTRGIVHAMHPMMLLVRDALGAGSLLHAALFSGRAVCAGRPGDWLAGVGCGCAWAAMPPWLSTPKHDARGAGPGFWWGEMVVFRGRGRAMNGCAGLDGDRGRGFLEALLAWGILGGTKYSPLMTPWSRGCWVEGASGRALEIGAVGRLAGLSCLLV